MIQAKEREVAMIQSEEKRKILNAIKNICKKMNPEEIVYNTSKPAHSDFLIYWTGRDFDEDRYFDLTSSYSSKTKDELTKPYLERLTSILKYGLWMCKSKGDEEIYVNKQKFLKPSVPRACFTELRLSEVRKHALKYGRLGIGVKRYFVFNRLGGPLAYIQKCTNNLLFPPFSDFFSTKKKNENEKEILSFAKHMCPPGLTPKRYDLLDESEWRIIYSDEIRKKIEEFKIKNNKNKDILKLFKEPSEIKDKAFQEYIKKHDKENRLRYLIELDRWFAMIIYPSLKIKVKSEACSEIRALIEKIKPTLEKGKKPDEKHSKPIELNLDACRNF